MTVVIAERRRRRLLLINAGEVTFVHYATFYILEFKLHYSHSAVMQMTCSYYKISLFGKLPVSLCSWLFAAVRLLTVGANEPPAGVVP